jgi:hypothetical protein
MVLLIAFSFMALNTTLSITFKFNQSALVTDFTNDQEKNEEEKELSEDDVDYFFASQIYTEPAAIASMLLVAGHFTLSQYYLRNSLFLQFFYMLKNKSMLKNNLNLILLSYI